MKKANEVLEAMLNGRRFDDVPREDLKYGDPFPLTNGHEYAFDSIVEAMNEHACNVVDEILKENYIHNYTAMTQGGELEKFSETALLIKKLL